MADLIERLRQRSKTSTDPLLAMLAREAASEIEALTAQVAVMGEALAPFAVHAEDYIDAAPDTMVVLAAVTVGELRKARLSTKDVRAAVALGESEIVEAIRPHLKASQSRPWDVTSDYTVVGHYDAARAILALIPVVAPSEGVES